MCNLEDYDKLEMTDWHRKLLKLELPMWHRIYYQGPGLIVDEGAGCGETALFYLNHGAEQVIAIENDVQAFNMLVKNFAHDIRVTPVFGRVTHTKIDIEGDEIGMLIEPHFKHKWKRVNYNPPMFRLVKVRDYFHLYQLRHRMKIWIAHQIRLHVLGPRK
jgi:tRNA G37 N-methylase Trm5